MQPAAFSGRSSASSKGSHPSDAQREKTPSEPRSFDETTAESSLTDGQGGPGLGGKDFEAQLPPERVDSIESHAGSYYSHSSHSSHSDSSGASLPRWDSFATTVTLGDSDDDAASGQRHVSLPIRQGLNLGVLNYPDNGVLPRRDSSTKWSSIPKYPAMRDAYARQAHNTFPVTGKSTLPLTNTPHLPSESGVLRRETMPESNMVELEEQQQQQQQQQMLGMPERTAPGAASQEANDGSQDTQLKVEPSDDVEVSVMTVEPATPVVSSPASGEGTPKARWPRDKLTEDLCDTLLKDAFGVELQELPIHTVMEAWSSVNACLEEVSNLLSANKSATFSLPIRQSAGSPTPGSSTGARVLQGDTTAGTGNGNEFGKGKKRQKPPSDFDGNGDGGEDESDGERSPRDGEPGKKKTKIDGPEQPFSCPYRKRNPRRFNIRDHTPCAMSRFDDVSHVKRHVKKFHRRESTKFVCPFCKTDLYTRDALGTHLMSAMNGACQPIPESPSDDPEAGITPRVEESLNDRKTKTKIDSWEALWRELFPGDENIPSSVFVPPVELVEVEAEFENSAADLSNRVDSEIQSIPDIASSARPHIASQLQAALGRYIKQVFENSQLHATSCTTRRRHRNNPNNGGGGSSSSSSSSSNSNNNDHQHNFNNSNNGSSSNANTATLQAQTNSLLAPPNHPLPRQIAPSKAMTGNSGGGSSLSSSMETTSASATSWGAGGTSSPMTPPPPPVTTVGGGTERPKVPFRDSAYCEGNEGAAAAASATYLCQDSVTENILEAFDTSEYGPEDAFHFNWDGYTGETT